MGKTMSPTELAKKLQESSNVEQSAPEETTPEVNEVETPQVAEGKNEPPVATPEPAPEVEPEVKQEPKIEPAVVRPVAASPKSTATRILEDMIGNYLSAAREIIPVQKKCCAALHGVLQYVISQQNDPEVLLTFYEFMTELGSSRPSPDWVFMHMESMSKLSKDRVSALYVLVYEMLSDRKPAIDYEHCQRLFGGDALVNFVQSRMR